MATHSAHRDKAGWLHPGATSPAGEVESSPMSVPSQPSNPQSLCLFFSPPTFVYLNLNLRETANVFLHRGVHCSCNSGTCVSVGPWCTAVRNQAERAGRWEAAPLDLSRNLLISEVACFNPREQKMLGYRASLSIPCYLRLLKWVKRQPVLPQWGIWVLQITLFLCPREQVGGHLFMKGPWARQLPLTSHFAFKTDHRPRNAARH